MAIHILIGAGGTGAKLVEAALFLFSAGLGPRGPVHVALVDQDNSNGNVVRTLELLTLIQRLRADFSQQDSANRLDWARSPAAGGTPFLSVDVKPIFGDTAHWRPAPEADATLQSILRTNEMSKEERDFFALLFRDAPDRPADAEQQMPLDGGYSGRAHVGAAAMLSAFHFDQKAFKDRLEELLRQSTNQEVRVFLLGSLFGGTGAAGFPTIARSVDALRVKGREANVNADQIKLGGALMLPYFSFADPEQPGANVVRHTQLLPQAKVALAFYDALLGERRTFDRLYIAGWDGFFDLPYHEPRHEAQKNPPLLPELLGAMAAVEFFMADRLDRDPDARLEPLACGRAHGGHGPVRWNDLPVEVLDRRLVYDRLARLVRFVYWWRYRIEPAFDNRTGGIGSLLARMGLGSDTVKVGNIRLPWLRNLANGTDWQQKTPEARQRLLQFAESLKTWAAAMELFAEERGHSFDLWDLAHACDRREANTPRDPVGLHAEQDEGATTEGFGRLVKDLDAEARARSAAELFEELHMTNVALPEEGSRALGRVVWAVHRAARPFGQEV